MPAPLEPVRSCKIAPLIALVFVVTPKPIPARLPITLLGHRTNILIPVDVLLITIFSPLYMLP